MVQGSVKEDRGTRISGKPQYGSLSSSRRHVCLLKFPSVSGDGFGSSKHFRSEEGGEAEVKYRREIGEMVTTAHSQVRGCRNSLAIVFSTLPFFSRYSSSTAPGCINFPARYSTNYASDERVRPKCCFHDPIYRLCRPNTQNVRAMTDRERNSVRHHQFIQQRPARLAVRIFPPPSIATLPSSSSLLSPDSNYSSSYQSPLHLSNQMSLLMQFSHMNNNALTFDPRFQAPHLQERSLSQESIPQKQPHHKASMPHLTKEERKVIKEGSSSVRIPSH